PIGRCPVRECARRPPVFESCRMRGALLAWYFVRLAIANPYLPWRARRVQSTTARHTLARAGRPTAPLQRPYSAPRRPGPASVRRPASGVRPDGSGVRTTPATAPHRRPPRGGCPHAGARVGYVAKPPVQVFPEARIPPFGSPLTILRESGCHRLVYRKGGQASVAFVQDDALVRAWLDAGGEGELVPPAVAVGGDSASGGHAECVVLAPGAVGARGVRAGLARSGAGSFSR